MSSAKTQDALQLIREGLEGSIVVKQQVLNDPALLATIAEMAQRIAEAIAAGNKLLLCGNGGSAADAQHLAAELIVRLRPDVNRNAMPALSLCMDSSTMTACANDYGFDDVFSRPLEAFAKPGDILFGITTSGKSPNVIKAMDKAREIGIPVFGLLGSGGGPALEKCDLAFVAPGSEVARIQECHITVGHLLMELIEEISLGRVSGSGA